MIFTKIARYEQSISRRSLAWLLAVQIFILAPHFVTAPWWIAVVWLMVAVWRWRIFQGAWNYPSKFKKTALVAACCVGLFLSLGGSFRFESMVSLLLVGFTLKLLELKNQKDFVLLIFIALFILAAQFIEALFDCLKLHNTIIKVSLSCKQEVWKGWGNENGLRGSDGVYAIKDYFIR